MAQQDETINADAFARLKRDWREQRAAILADALPDKKIRLAGESGKFFARCLTLVPDAPLFAYLQRRRDRANTDPTQAFDAFLIVAACEEEIIRRGAGAAWRAFDATGRGQGAVSRRPAAKKPWRINRNSPI